MTNVSITFNVFYLSLFDASEDSRTNLFKRGANDLSRDEQETVKLFRGPISRARAKEIKDRAKV